MKHRFPSDHDCSSRKAEAARSRRPVASAVRSFLRMGSGKAASPAPPAKREAPVQASAKSSASAAAKAAAEAAERRNNPSSRAQLVNPPATSGDGSAAAFSQHTAERCPQCGAAFKTLQELLFHVEAFHPDGAASSAPAAGIERCPDCGQSFANAVTLVEHVERNHARKQLCVLC
ncbi:hypothetical protein CVIRNUC_002912 [Coccomyxa viridis]|uniref:C2H2-type domain-containing protein n=1 Tax=Coccomyxa viridis TaxID=1274662 RepID=A0AAV1HYZ5_9CHLO|nr:hypothetical protein CVIRNUC_002912 [Coccomyxa viridis]